MKPETVIKVENLSKQYRLGNVGLGSLGADANRWWQSKIFENGFGRIIMRRVFWIGLNFDALRKWMEWSVAKRNKTLSERSEFVLLSETQSVPIAIGSNRNYSLDSR